MNTFTKCLSVSGIAIVGALSIAPAVSDSYRIPLIPGDECWLPSYPPKPCPQKWWDPPEYYTEIKLNGGISAARFKIPNCVCHSPFNCPCDSESSRDLL